MIQAATNADEVGIEVIKHKYVKPDYVDHHFLYHMFPAIVDWIYGFSTHFKLIENYNFSKTQLAANDLFLAQGWQQLKLHWVNYCVTSQTKVAIYLAQSSAI